MPSVSGPATGRTYWRSLDDLANTEEFRRFVENEFPSLAPDTLNGPSRRQFLRLMGASAALAGLAGCRWPVEKIAPYGSRPEGRIPGVPVRYATAMDLGGVAAGLLVTSYDGRPIKIEGNPGHPVNRGATDAFAQASVLELYDPDRLKGVVEHADGSPSASGFYRSWDEFAAFAKRHFGAIRSSGGAGLAVLSEADSSISLADMRGRFLNAVPQAKWHEYEPVSRDNERLGSRAAFGQVYRTHYALDQADVIVSLDADLLMTHPAAVKHARDFVAGRDVDEHGHRRDNGRGMNRLYVVESTYSVTGGMADHRLAVTSAMVAKVACRLAARLAANGLELPVWLEAVVQAGMQHPVGDDSITEPMAKDLLAARGRGVVAVGPRQPAEVHALAHALNAALGNAGTTVRYTAEPDGDRPTHVESIRALAGDMHDGKVETLLILGGDPVFDAPADVDFAGGLAKVATTLHLTLFANETSQACTWRLPRAHYLESWSDARAYDGTISVVQPLIQPLYDGKTPAEVLALVMGETPASGYDIVRRTFQPLCRAADFESWWQHVLHDGLVSETAWPQAAPTPNAGAWLNKLTESAGQDGGGGGQVEVVFTSDHHVYDGRFANNGWLQEMPDPITKLTWDNAALICPAMARRLGVISGDVVLLESGDHGLDIPVYVLPGHAEGSVTVPVGYGRTAAGRVGDGTGVNAYRLRTTAAMNVAPAVRITKTERHNPLAGTQDHHAMDTEVGRKAAAERLGMLIREATVEEYAHHPDFARHAVHSPPLISLWQEPSYEDGHRWGMAIDLNKCTGCSACVVACQAENNVPVVGKDEVARGREMHWLRIDRYFKGPPDDPQVAHQPVTCHHCENAPCEQVCPVAATTHSDEGLNDMVYNRCVGTRYCANNCPYKVRRFNWFNNHKNLSETEKMAFNPEVTVRSRGVMEKCTFCVQRISAVKIAAKNEARPIVDGEVVTACAQACPTQAIVFGDLNDPNSRVAALHAEQRSYGMLAELNVKPRTHYLAKLRNPAGAAHEHGHTGELAHESAPAAQGQRKKWTFENGNWTERPADGGRSGR